MQHSNKHFLLAFLNVCCCILQHNSNTLLCKCQEKMMKMNSSWTLCSFGEKSEKLRKERGISKAELCRRLRISVSYYNYIIHGREVLKQQFRIINELSKFDVGKTDQNAS